MKAVYLSAPVSGKGGEVVSNADSFKKFLPHSYVGSVSRLPVAPARLKKKN